MVNSRRLRLQECRFWGPWRESSVGPVCFAGLARRRAPRSFRAPSRRSYAISVRWQPAAPPRPGLTSRSAADVRSRLDLWSTRDEAVFPARLFAAGSYFLACAFLSDTAEAHESGPVVCEIAEKGRITCTKSYRWRPLSWVTGYQSALCGGINLPGRLASRMNKKRTIFPEPSALRP